MKKMMQTLLYPLLTIAVLFFAYTALAEVPGSKPLVILRFNQPRVYYEQPLFQAVEKAVALKPSVMFDVISYAPTANNTQAEAAWQQTASRNTQAVVASMQKMGIPLSRMAISGQRQSGLTSDEVHIFVR